MGDYRKKLEQDLEDLGELLDKGFDYALKEYEESYGGFGSGARFDDLPDSA